MITHIALFRLKDRSPENIERAARVLRGMEGRIDELLSLEVGVDVLRSGHSYDIALTAKFESLEALGAYQIHPVHQEIVRYMSQVGEASVCVDYESD
jgi:hypothetical protein